MSYDLRLVYSIYLKTTFVNTVGQNWMYEDDHSINVYGAYV